MFGEYREHTLNKISNNDLARVQNKDLGPILLENEAVPLINMFRPIPTNRTQKNIIKYGEQSKHVQSTLGVGIRRIIRLII